MCEGSFSGVSGSFKEVSRKFQECLKEVSGVFTDSFRTGRLKGIAREISVVLKSI